MSIEVRNVTKSFGRFRALDNVSLTIPTGELTVLLGPSGSGKTTLLRIIAGLEQPDAGNGSISFNGRDVASERVQHRQVGFVFQHYALFRHMTVFENVAFGLRVKRRRDRPDAAQIREKVHELLRLVQVDFLGNRYPNQLSGGQRQRVALARALAVEPSVLLLDEPFGALDAKVRKELRMWLRRLHDEIHVTSVMVTHDQDEALEVADRVVVMNEARIEQVGTPDDVFHRPVSAFVMSFLGQVNFFRGRSDEGKRESEAGDGSPQASTAADAEILVRPHDLEVLAVPNGQSIPARIARSQSAGPFVRLDLIGEDGQTYYAEMSHREYAALGAGHDAQVFVRPRQVRVFRPNYQI